jgi:hypothetical protein
MPNAQKISAFFVERVDDSEVPSERCDEAQQHFGPRRNVAQATILKFVSSHRNFAFQ